MKNGIGKATVKARVLALSAGLVTALLGGACASAPASSGAGTVFRYGPAAGQEVEVRAPANRKVTGGIVVLVHGGGWHYGSRADMKWTRDTLLAAGFTVYNMDYRLGSPPWFVQVGNKLDDIDTVVRLARRQAEDGGLPARIHLMGASAGGHLSLLYAYGRGRGLVSSVVSLFGPTALDNPAYQTNGLAVDIAGLIGQPWGPEAAGAYRQASPLCLVQGGECPTLLYHGDADKLVPYGDAEALGQALRRAGVTHRLVTIAGGGHGDGWPAESWSDFNRDMIAWFRSAP